MDSRSEKVDYLLSWNNFGINILSVNLIVKNVTKLATKTLTIHVISFTLWVL